MGGELLFSFTGIDPVQLLAIWAIVVFAAVIRAFTGFGFALAAVPVFSLFMQPSQAVVLSVLLALTVSLLTLRTYWGKCPIKPMLPMVGFSVIGTAIGALILARVATDAFQLAIGVCVIVVSLVLTLYKPAKHRVGLVATAVTGLASGLMNGALAIPGPPVIIYAVATQPTAEQTRAFMMTFFLFSGSVGLLSYSAAGFVGVTSLWLFLLALPALYLGDKLGYFLFRRHGTTLYRRVALAVLFAVGVAITARAII